MLLWVAYDGKMRASFTETLTELDGVSVSVKRFDGTGPASGRDFVLVHGVGMSSRYFHPLATELAAQGTVWVIDLPGYGASPRPRDAAGHLREMTIADHADALGRWITAAGISDPVLVGHSMGCQVVTRLVVDAPATSDRVVLIAPTINPEARTLYQQSKKLAYDGMLESTPVNFILVTDSMFRAGPRYFFHQLRHLLTDRIEDRLPQVAAKTLVIVGEDDPIVPVEWASLVSRLVQRGRLLVTDGPHIVMYRRAKEIAPQIVQHAMPDHASVPRAS